MSHGWRIQEVEDLLETDIDVKAVLNIQCSPSSATRPDCTVRSPSCPGSRSRGRPDPGQGGHGRIERISRRCHSQSRSTSRVKGSIWGNLSVQDSQLNTARANEPGNH